MSTFSTTSGHYLKTNWGDASDTAARRVGKVVEFLILAENEYQELLQIWTYHGNDDQAVANQLFGHDQNQSPAPQASADQLLQTQDLKAAMVAVHNAYVAFDFDAARKMT